MIFYHRWSFWFGVRSFCSGYRSFCNLVCLFYFHLFISWLRPLIFTTIIVRSSILLCSMNISFVLRNCIFIRPTSDGTYYGMVMSVRPSAHFLHFSHTCFDIMSWNFAHDFVLLTTDQVWVSSLCVNFWRSYAVRLSVRPSVRVSVRPFSALFSYMLWHIELKFCTWLCFNVLQIKFECRHFASIVEGVMPLCELRI